MSTEDRGYPVGPTDAADERSLFSSIMDGGDESGQQAPQDGGESDEGEGGDAGAQAGGEGEVDGRARDAQGRFIEPKPQEQQPGQDRAQKGLRGEVVSERGRRQAAEAAREADRLELAKLRGVVEQLQRQQQAPAQPAQPAQAAKEPDPAPDMWTDPEGYRNYVIREAEQRAVARFEQESQQRVEFSLQATQARDPQTFNAAYQAAQSLDPQSRAQVLQRLKIAPDAGAFLLDWHRQHQARQEIGADPNAYRERVRAEAADPQKLMQDPAFRAAALELLRAEASQGGANGGPRTLNQLPPSLNGSRGSNARTSAADAYDNSERGVFEYAARG